MSTGTETNGNASTGPFELNFELDGGASSGTSLSTGTETNANANIGPFELDDALDFLASGAVGVACPSVL